MDFLLAKNLYVYTSYGYTTRFEFLAQIAHCCRDIRGGAHHRGSLPAPSARAHGDQ
jgi:hypothetical protein